MLGIYYLDYSDKLFPRSTRKLIIGYTRSEFLLKIREKHIPDNWFCWLSECDTPGYLIEGNIEAICKWVDAHMPEEFGSSLL